MKRILTLINCSIIILLTGCWDEFPIDERGFVIGSAIDLAEEQQEGTYQVTLTNQFVVPAGITSFGQGGGGGDQNAFKNISATGESLFQISRHMSTLTNWIPNYEHLKVLIVSKEIASEPDLFASVMDGFIRDHEMRRGIRVMISEGKAKDILEIKPENEQLPAMFIDTLMENNINTIELTEPVRVGMLHRYLLNENSYVIPRITMEQDTVHYNGVAVFDGKTDNQVGTLSGEETKGLNLMEGNITSGSIAFNMDNKKMVYEINNSRSNMKIDVTNRDDINISITIDTEGSLAEMFGSKSLLDQSYLEKMEKKLNEVIEQLVMQTVEKVQQELKVDVFGFSNRLRQRHYDEWEKMKDDWDHGENLFSKSTVDVSVHSVIRNIGASNKAKDKENE